MAHPMGEAKPGPVRIDYHRRLKLEFHGSRISSDAGPLVFREFAVGCPLCDHCRATFVGDWVEPSGESRVTGCGGETCSCRRPQAVSVGGDPGLP